MPAIAHQAAPEQSHLSLVRTHERPTRPQLVAVPAIGDSAISHVHTASTDQTLEIVEPHTQFVQSLAVVIFEVIEGSRGIQQLGGSVTLRTHRQIAGYRAARMEQRTVLGIRPSTVHHVGRVRIDRPCTNVAEAATVVYVGKRARAVAMRLEWEHSRWRAGDIAVL